MITLISVCSYLFYTYKDSILSYIRASNFETQNSNEENIEHGVYKVKSTRKRKKNPKIRYISDSEIGNTKYILRTYSDVDFPLRSPKKKIVKKIN
ncbi:conserved protein, unknown function [Hepatocystis sp. ex Piliocolobus tephrosceles]|nr:conserved protein, unknown function [Hepatocystis sp. ex Piliocolobus tephrosceles]